MAIAKTTTRAEPAGVAKSTSTRDEVFEALDQIDQALSRVGHTVGLLSVLLSPDYPDPDMDQLCTVERHLLSDLTGLREAKERAWDSLLRKGGAS